MRVLALASLTVLAACSEAAEQPKAEEEAPAVSSFEAGQWEVQSEVVSLTQRDKGSPALKTPEGTKASASTCIAEADIKKPQPALFVPKEFNCTYRDSYISSGRLNATLACKRPGLNGNVAVVVNGNYTGDTLEATTVTETQLYGDGDVRVETKLNGRRTGACTAPAAEGGK